MNSRSIFFVSLLISLLVNGVVFGFLIRFSLSKPKEISTINISFEEGSSHQSVEAEKSPGKIKFHKEAGEKKKLKRKKQPVLEQKGVKGTKFYRKIKPTENQEKFSPKRSYRVVRESEQKKFSKSENGNLNKVLVKKIFSDGAVVGLKPRSVNNSNVRTEVKEGKGSSPPLHREETSVEKTGNMVSGSPISGGVAGAPKKTKENGENRADKKDRENYLRFVLQEVEKNKFYPLIARRMGIEGKVKLKIVIGKGGELLSVSVLSSDSEILKKAAIKTIKKCHFPPPPGGKFETDLTIHYKLK